MTLRQLGVGEKGKITHVFSGGIIRKKLVEMGMAPGVVVEIRGVAPLGDPIDVKVKGYHLSLRKLEAEGIAIEPL